jgi:aarF domain-containing kinase
LTTRKVLVTEWIEGNKLAQSEAEIINRLTPVGVECFLAQLLETGQFHADPHPGNLLVTTDGRLALIDFGLCAEVPLPDTKTMTLAIVHLMQGDVSGLLEDAIELGFLPQVLEILTKEFMTFAVKTHFLGCGQGLIITSLGKNL